MKQKYFLYTSVIFIVLSVLLFIVHVYAPDYSFFALEVGNAIMALLVVAAWFMVNKQTGADRPHAFVNGVYSASLLKLMVCMFAMLIYVFLNRSHVHKPTVFVLFGIYAVYTIMETTFLSKRLRK